MVRLFMASPLVASGAILAEKPPMGWRSWNAFRLEVDQNKMLMQVKALVETGLLDAGYDEIGIDDGWQACGSGKGGGFHDEATGAPIVNTSLFPDMLAMTRDAHSRGVKMGWYMNTCWCGQQERETWTDSGGNPLQDVAATVAFEFDGLKVDGCGPAHNITIWGQALRASGRDVVLENCADNTANVKWTPAVPADVETCDFEFYRISRDIAPHYNSVMWNLQHGIPFQDLEKPLSRPGCWAYPDMMQVGSNPNGALTLEESRSHFFAWCVTSSPLILGFDLTNTSVLNEVLSIITNPRAISINQAWYGHPGRLVRNGTKTITLPVPHEAPCHCCEDLNTCKDVWEAPVTQIWTKPIAANKVAVLVLNHDDREHEECFTSDDLGFEGKAFYLQDVSSGSQSTVTSTEQCCKLSSHDSCFFTATLPGIAI